MLFAFIRKLYAGRALMNLIYLRPRAPVRLLPFVAAAVLLSASLAAHADDFSYQLFFSSDASDFVAVDDYGDYVIRNLEENCPSDNGCFVGSVSGIPFDHLNSPPSLPANPSVSAGPGCNVTSAGYFTEATLCKNGYEYLLATASPLTDLTSIYAASDPNTPLGVVEQTAFFMTDNGSIYFNSALNDYLGRVLDVTTTEAARVAVTPEPSSIAMFGTGMLGLAGVIKRRFA